MNDKLFSLTKAQVKSAREHLMLVHDSVQETGDLQGLGHGIGKKYYAFSFRLKAFDRDGGATEYTIFISESNGSIY